MRPKRIKRKNERKWCLHLQISSYFGDISALRNYFAAVVRSTDRKCSKKAVLGELPGAAGAGVPCSTGATCTKRGESGRLS